MSTQHKLKYIRSSMVLWKGKPIEIEVWRCEVETCGKYMIIDLATGGRINLNGLIGEEISEQGSDCD